MGPEGDRQEVALDPARVERGRELWRRILAGGNPLTPETGPTLRLAAAMGRLGALTPAEERILSMVAEGMTAKEIAAELGISFEAVRSHEKRVRLKLGARNNAHAVAIILRS